MSLAFRGSFMAFLSIFYFSSEIIVQAGSVVRPSVVVNPASIQTHQTSSTQKPLSQSKPNFTCSLSTSIGQGTEHLFAACGSHDQDVRLALL